tara:strand:- start:71 stop:511 length:441 start_codon:yes stop_codon:yes gene_type:complete
MTELPELERLQKNAVETKAAADSYDYDDDAFYAFDAAAAYAKARDELSNYLKEQEMDKTLEELKAELVVAVEQAAKVEAECEAEAKARVDAEDWADLADDLARARARARAEAWAWADDLAMAEAKARVERIKAEIAELEQDNGRIN